ncbi:transposase [Candidatus Sumerlaeota bacterium]
MSEPRRRFSSEQEAAVVREHLIDRVAVSELCDKHGIQPTVFCRWQKTMFENLPALLERRGGSPQTRLLRENEALQTKTRLAQKDEVIAWRIR